MQRRLLAATIAQFIIGFGVTLVVQSQFGVDPWTVFMQGASSAIHLSLGRTSQAVSLVLIALSYLLGGEVPGWGTLLNTILVGSSIDAFLPLIPAPAALAPRVAFLLAGVCLMAFGIATYVRTDLGKGPMEGWAFTVGKLLRLGIGRAKFIADLLAMLTGLLLGGKVGWGTLVSVAALGPLLRFFLRRPVDRALPQA